MRFRVVVCAAIAAALGASPAIAQQPATGRWTAATPDRMVEQALARARRGGDDAIAALVIAAALDERAPFGQVRAGLKTIADIASPVADDARWLGLALEPSPAGAAWAGSRSVAWDSPADALGLVRALAVLGPFQDTDGGGLTRAEGPEAPGARWNDTAARYSWGVYEVAWRRALPTSMSARGLPLDLYVHPRSESCTYLASRVSFPAGAAPVLVHVASTGAVRLTWDGADVAIADDVHTRMVLDRVSAKIGEPAGTHLLSLKVCSAAMADEGRVRIRFTDEARRPVPVSSSSDLSRATLPERPRPAAADKPAAKPSEKPSDKSGEAAPKASAAPQPTPPRGVQVVPTTLARALPLAQQPGVDRLLTAIVVRTLAGADDARSPRAPGLLDRAVRDPALSADQLALAGWVSPFGANRSGWLNQAKAKALAARDADTAAFAQRRLAAAHLGAVFADWALSLVREEPLRSARDPEARLIRAIAQKHLGAPGLARAALDDLLAVASESGQATPVSVWLEIADLSRSDPKTQLRAARRLAEVRAEAMGPAWVRAHRAQDGSAMEVAAAKALAQQTTAEDVVQIGRDLLDAGRHQWSREAFHLATELAPNRAPAFRGLAAARQAVAAAELRASKKVSEDPELAVLALARARDLEPGDAGLRAELAFRVRPGGGEARPGDRRETLADERYIVAPSVFLARARQKPAKKGEVFDRQLHWLRAVTYHPDKRVSQLMHYAREIVVEPRTEAELVERDVPAESDETELLLARVHRRDGTVAAPEEQSAGGRKPFVRWPELKAGDVVEIAVRSWTAGPVGRRGDAPFYFIDYVGSTDTHPILYNEVVVDSPEVSPLAIDVLNGKAERVTVDAKNGRRITRMIWDSPSIVRDEPLAPKLSESLPVVVGSTFATWHDFREWYRGAVAGFTEPDDQVRRLAGELTAGKKGQDDKIRALFEFVADDIRYVNYVSGEWWLPNRPQELLARRQGDCDDKAILLISLLKSIGIEATEVLVQTRYTGQPSLLRSEKAAIPVFDHGIAYLPGKGGKPGMWLDATSPQSRLGPLPAMDSRTLALFVHDGAGKIVETPPASPDDHGVDARWTLRLTSSGAGELTASERHIGDASFELRMNLREADARSQWVEQYLASGWLATVQLTGEVDFQGDLAGGAATLKYQARSDAAAQREGEELAVPVAEAQTLTSQLAPLVKRTLPVVLPPRLAPGHEKRVITILAPPGYLFADLPPAGEEAGGEFGRAKLTFSRTGADAVVVERTVVFDLSTIPVDKYPAWRAWLQRVDGLMHRMVRLVPRDPKAAAAKPVSLEPPRPSPDRPAPPQPKPQPPASPQPPAALPPSKPDAKTPALPLR